MTGYCYIFKFTRRSVGGKRLMRFQSKTSVFKPSSVVWNGHGFQYYSGLNFSIFNFNIV